MNLLLLEETDRLDDDRFAVTGRRARHVFETLDKKAGETLRVGLVDGPLGEATVLESTEDRLDVRVTFGETPPRPTVDLVVAVPRPKSLKKLLRAIATLGVDRLVLLRTWRVDKAYLGSPLLDPARARPLLLEGLEQARDTRLPVIHVAPLFKPWVEDEALRFRGDARAVVLHPDPAAPHLAMGALGAEERITIAIGPEGGFLPYEVEAFEAAGFARHHLGARILRVETACVAALATVAAVRARTVV